MVTRDAHHPLRGDRPGCLSEQLTRALLADMRDLAGDALVDIRPRHIKAGLRRRPPNVALGILHELGALGIPGRSDTDLVGDRRAALYVATGSPLLSEGFKHPGLVGIGYQKSII